MPNTTDVLNPPSPPSRVYYSTGRMLGVEDFQADQDYHRGRLARALLQLFGTGTVSGLNVAIGNDPGDGSLEVQVSPGMAIDRVGRIIEVPRQVCIRIKNWYAQADPSTLNQALHVGSVVVDVFATFIPCTRGATPCFASQDDYDATDAFSPNRWLDSFAMQLVPRTDITDATQKLPKDPWSAPGAAPPPPVAITATPSTPPSGTTPPSTPATPVPTPTPIPAPGPPAQSATGGTLDAWKQSILAGTAGPAASAPFGPGQQGVEYPPGFDNTAVFLARIQIPATARGSGQAPSPSFDTIHQPDNSQRLFVFPSSLVARWAGLTSGTEGA
jgi:hypothetical protein